MNRTVKSLARDQMYKWKSYRDLLRLLSFAFFGFLAGNWTMVLHLGMIEKRPVAIGMSVLWVLAVLATCFAWYRLVHHRKRFETIATTPQYVEELLQ